MVSYNNKMETNSMVSNEEDQMELPPGFRFYPTDEELITHYLSYKVLDNNFCARAIGEVDLNKCEPWDLPWRAKMGEKEWYFFCVRDRKYPTGLRTNRATEAGYWKATGKDKEIHRAKTLVGMKKTLVFYRGRAPKGEKSNWVMHEYRLEGQYSFYNLPKSPKNEWVICRIFQKTGAGKKVHISGLAVMNHPHGNESKQQLPSSTSASTSTSLLPPLTDSSPNTSETRTNQPDTCHVSCFSNPMETGDRKSQEHMLYNTNNCFKYTSPISSHNNNISPVYLNSAPPIPPSTVGNIQFRDSFLMSDQSPFRLLLENQAPNMKRIDTCSRLTNEEMFRVPFEDQVDPSISAAPIDLDCLWNY